MPKKTHYEQIPVETVKRITAELPAAIAVQERDETAHPQERWRETALQVVEEPDPTKMVQLVEQLLTEFDKKSPRKGSSSAERL